MVSDSSVPQPDSDGVTRRTVIRRAAVVGAAAAVGVGLAACGDDEPADSAASGGETSTAPIPETSPSDTAGGGGGSADAIAKTSDIPVGSGKVVDAGGRSIVVMQPSEGTFTALSAICTHQGCKVKPPENGVLNCPCHQSAFNQDGSVKNGPAAGPLEKVNVSVEGDSVVLT